MNDALLVPNARQPRQALWPGAAKFRHPGPRAGVHPFPSSSLQRWIPGQARNEVRKGGRDADIKDDACGITLNACINMLFSHKAVFVKELVRLYLKDQQNINLNG
jgi:hypothetical protein